jgi:hypothetical protein
VRGRDTKGMVGLAAFLVAAVSAAAPGVSDLRQEGLVWRACREVLEKAVGGGEGAYITGLRGGGLAGVNAEFHRAPVRFGGSTRRVMLAKSLAPGPRILLMVLAGFLCVLAVKNRGTGLGAVSCLLRLGHAGFSSFRQLGSRAAGERRPYERSSVWRPLLDEAGHRCYLRGDVEGIFSIEVLPCPCVLPGRTRSLVFSSALRSFPSCAKRVGVREGKRMGCGGWGREVGFLRWGHKFEAAESARGRPVLCQVCAGKCPASRTEPCSCFTTEFAAIRGARGPPCSL